MQQCQIPVEEVQMINSGPGVEYAIIHDIFNSISFDNGSQQKAMVHNMKWHVTKFSF